MQPPVISDIKETKKGRYALFCDGEFLLSVDSETFIEFAIHRDMQMDDETLRQLRARSDYRRARAKALELLGHRAHSKKELYDKLVRRYDAYTAAAAVADAEKLGYIDDAAYARECVDYVFAARRFSRRAAEHYLKERGIDGAIIETVLESYAEDETGMLRALVEQKHLARLGRENGYQNVFAALARKGFGPNDIRKVLNEYVENGYDEE